MLHTLMEVDPRFPAVRKKQREALAEVKAALEAQAPTGAAPDGSNWISEREGHDCVGSDQHGQSGRAGAIGVLFMLLIWFIAVRGIIVVGPCGAVRRARDRRA